MQGKYLYEVSMHVRNSLIARDPRLTSFSNRPAVLLQIAIAGILFDNHTLGPILQDRALMRHKRPDPLVYPLPSPAP